MKRPILILILLLSLGAGPAAPAQETNAAPAALDWSSFQDIAQKNIFDPSRNPGRSEDGPARRPIVIHTFTFRGTVDDRAIFTGDGAGTGCLARGDIINGFKVAQVPISYDDAIVVLTDSNNVVVNLREGEGMTQQDDGPWSKSDQPPPVAISVTPSAGASDSAPAAATSIEPVGLTGAAREAEILRRLKLRREQEDK